MRLPTRADEIARIASEMERTGYAVIPDAVSPDDISGAKAFAMRELARHNGQYFCLDGPDAMQGTFMERLGRSSEFCNLLATIHRQASGFRGEPPAIYQTLRVLSGSSGVKESLKFHFDAFAVTALAPIAIPDTPGQANGDLVLYPNLRRIRSNVVVNVIEKAVFQNAFTRRVMSMPWVRRMLGAKVVTMQPGALYLFWGYRSLHANEACDPKSCRCTTLFHYFDPHEDSSLVRLIKARRRSIEAQGRARAIAGARS